MNIDKVRRKATVCGSDGVKVDVFFFLRQFAEEHTGRELIVDVLNSNATFISVVDLHSEEVFFVNKEGIMYLELDEQDLLDETMLLPEIRVRAELINGEKIAGSFFLDMPPERSRLSDFLNFTPQFLYLCKSKGDLILNKAYIRSVKEERN